MTTNARTLLATLGAAAAACLLTACPRGRTSPADPTPNPSAFTLPPAQRGKIHLEEAILTPFRRTVEATGTVEFDGDRATQVLAPFSGPVSRILVPLGALVRRGQPLATTVSPDFAAAVSAYRKAAATAHNARRIADLDAQLFADDAIARREMEQAQTDAVSAEADRDAALQQLRSLGVDDQAIEDLRQGSATAAPQGVIRAPLAGAVVERLITPGQLLQGERRPASRSRTCPRCG